MAEREVVTQDAATLEALDKAKILDELYDHKDTRANLLRGIKTIRPAARIPEIETTDQVMGALRPHLEEIGKTKTELAQEREAFRAERAREKAQRDLGLSDEEFVEVHKLAEDKKIGDLATAAEHYRLTREVAEPRTGPDTLQLPSMKGLWENPTAWAREEVRKVSHELSIAAKGRR